MDENLKKSLEDIVRNRALYADSTNIKEVVMDEITIERVEYTECRDCIFYSTDINACGYVIDSTVGPFACFIGDRHMMWKAKDNSGNLKSFLEDAFVSLRLCVYSVDDPKSPFYCTMTAQKIRDAFDACKEALEKINAP